MSQGLTENGAQIFQMVLRFRVSLQFALIFKKILRFPAPNPDARIFQKDLQFLARLSHPESVGAFQQSIPHPHKKTYLKFHRLFDDSPSRKVGPN